jgi:hypothetical protein
LTGNNNFLLVVQPGSPFEHLVSLNGVPQPPAEDWLRHLSLPELRALRERLHELIYDAERAEARKVIASQLPAALLSPGLPAPR